MSLTDPILQFQQTRAQVPFQPPTVCTAETFPILLAGVPALRKVPGLATLEDAGEAYFTSIPYCLSGEDRRPGCLPAAVRLRPAVPALCGPPGLPGLGHQRDAGTPAHGLCL